jgi:alkylation response protein AidB-like acyl-CoA dehydrogenase
MLLDDLRSQLPTFIQREQAAREEYPAKDIADLFNMGVIGGPLPKSVGGSDMTCEEAVSIIIELASATPSTALLACMPMGLAAGIGAAAATAPEPHKATVMQQLERIGADFKKQRFYAACNSERGAAGALTVMKTLAKKDAASGQWRLNGTKILASGGKNVAVFFSGATVDPNDLPGAAAVEFFLTESTAPGVNILNDWNGIGMRSTESHSVRYEDAHVREMLGFPKLLETAQPWAFSFCMFAAIPLGCVKGILGEMSNPAPTSPAMRYRLAEAQMRYEAARAYLLETARGWKPGSSGAWRQRCVRTKTYVTQDMTKLAAELFALTGGKHYWRGSRVSEMLLGSFAGTGLRPPLPLALDMVTDGYAFDPLA